MRDSNPRLALQHSMMNRFQYPKQNNIIILREHSTGYLHSSRMVICTGTGNDNRGDPDVVGVNTLRYPSLHPDTLVIGGIVFNTDSNQWERWDEGSSQPGSNWGRSFMVYDSTGYYSALELVANCERTIVFQEYYGVSWAIPKVAGIVATMLWANPYLSPSIVRHIYSVLQTKLTPLDIITGRRHIQGG
ncbi:MAG: S8 family serine peptidase [Promethearchaeota archaeon]